MHIRGNVSAQGESISLDVVDGQTSRGGSIGLNGGTLDVILVGPEPYLKADAATWTKLANNASAGQLLANRWVKTSVSNSDFASFAEFLVVPKLVSSLTSSSSLTKETTATVDGQKVVPTKDNGPNQGDPRRGGHGQAVHRRRGPPGRPTRR